MFVFTGLTMASTYDYIRALFASPKTTNVGGANPVITVTVPAARDDMTNVTTRTSADADANKQKADDEKKWPSDLDGFGYKWNKNGEIRHKITGKPFQYDVYNGNKSANQARYEAFGRTIAEEVYGKLEEAGLRRIYVPLTDDDTNEEPVRGFFFATEDYMTNTVGLMVLINGAGAVRAGQWSRRLVINVGLDAGSQLPYIELAKERGMAVVVLNTNDNSITRDDGKRRYIEHNTSPDEHGCYVWKTFIAKTIADKIVIVAHSAGGCVTLTIAKQLPRDFTRRVFAVCFTDSVHATPMDRSARSDWWLHMCNVAQNWVCSRRPVGAREKCRGMGIRGVRCVSAGTAVHEESSWKAIANVFEFIDERYQDTVERQKTGTKTKTITKQPLSKAEAMPKEEEEDDDQHKAKEASHNDSINPQAKRSRTVEMAEVEQDDGLGADKDTTDDANGVSNDYFH